MRIMTINVFAINRAYDRMCEAIRAADADVVVLSEIHEHWLEGLEPLRQIYPHGKAMCYRGRGAGIALISRLPLQRVETLRIGPTSVPSVVATLLIDGQPVTIIGTHPLAPVNRDFARFRNEQLAALAGVVLAQPNPAILLGDLNISPWSVFFADLLRAARLRDTRNGFGVQATWPATWPALLRIPVDHCLVTEGVRVDDRRVGPPVGSDHLPVTLELSVVSRAAATQESRA
jgi:endonuclease/exonuclease/phosphatase (EEP) superfamily protein YafD